MSYPVKMDQRPWKFSREALQKIRELGPKWLLERSGIVIYKNENLDSSHLGDTSAMPARFIAEEDSAMHDAPPWHESGTGCCSRRQHVVDHIMLEQYQGDEAKAMAAFAEEDPPLRPSRTRRQR